MMMGAEDLRQHAENLRNALSRKIAELWNCEDQEQQAILLRQTKALRARIEELDALTDDERRRN